MQHESRSRRKKREAMGRIVTAAVRLFREQGYEQTTVTQIAEAADVDPKTFFNYFGSKDAVLFIDVERSFDRLIDAIAGRRPGEEPGELLVRAVREYQAYRRPEVPVRSSEDLAAAAQLALSTPAIQAKGLYLMSELQQRMADTLVEVYGGELDPITASAMTGSVIGAIQHTSAMSVRLGRSQSELWEASQRGLEVALHGLISVRPGESSADGAPGRERGEGNSQHEQPEASNRP